MNKVRLKIDGVEIEAKAGQSILFAALNADKYIPHLCAHVSVSHLKDVVLSDCVYQGTHEVSGESAGKTVLEADAKGCGLCKVMVAGKDSPLPSCRITVEEGMEVITTCEELIRARQSALNRILTDHPHACLLCEQREGCSRTDCSMNVPVEERCCVLLGQCEIGKVADYVGYPKDLQKYIPPEEKCIIKDPLFIRDYSLCIGCLKCVRACREIAQADVLGAVLKDGKFVIGTHEPGDMPEAKCKFCGACVDICPTGAIRDREDVETPAKGKPLPCVHGCPAGIDIPAYVRKIAEGNLDAARKIILKSVPLPSTLGHVCFHPCEDHCRRSRLDNPVAICDLKRYAFESGDYPDPPVSKMKTGKQVAIVGAGPAGLSAAWLLSIKGHDVALYDEADKPGGFLRQAIPRFRMPEKALDKDLAYMEKLGIEFYGGRRLGDNLDARTLREFGYDAVILAMGTPRSKRIHVDGSELSQVLWGVDFLKDVISKRRKRMGGAVVVIGGGSVAVDTAMNARRLGAENVCIVSLESTSEMPAHPKEIKQAVEEGIVFHHGWGPAKFHGPDNVLEEAEFKACVSVFDESGNFAPRFADGKRMTLTADWVILAVGQDTDREAFGAEAGTLLKNRGLLPPESESVETWLPGYFAAGDIVHGPSSVIEAIASGKRTAISVDKFLGGDGVFDTDHGNGDGHEFNAKSVTLEGRKRPESTSPESRTKNFELIELALEPLAAEAEANRCLRCNIRQQIQPAYLPPESWLALTSGNLGTVPAKPGVCTLTDGTGKILRISGTPNMAILLEEWLEEEPSDVWGDSPIAVGVRKFRWEEDDMYTKRESELIQQHLQKYGEMPGGDDDMDDLF
ncbi:FAD-dependent oxidoreductase [bacterium]|nr:FAD-dependent oxidoreductase [bacterium]